MGNRGSCQAPPVGHVCDAEACNEDRHSPTEMSVGNRSRGNEVIIYKMSSGMDHVEHRSLSRQRGDASEKEIRTPPQVDQPLSHISVRSPRRDRLAQVQATPRTRLEQALTAMRSRKKLGPGQFSVELVTGPACLPLAITVSPDDDPNVLTIDEIFSLGLIDSWNRSRKASEAKVCIGDMIVCVNGSEASGAEMLEILSASESSGTYETIDLFILPRSMRQAIQEWRKTEAPKADADSPLLDPLRAPFVVNVVMGPGCLVLGLALVESTERDRLIVENVWPSGLIARWNAAQPEGLQLHRGDFITSVNDKVAQSQEDMLKEIFATQTSSMERSQSLRLCVLPGVLNENETPLRKPSFF